MQISVASPSSKFNSQKSFVKKLSVYFLAICANFPKLRNLNQKFQVQVFQGQDFAFGAVTDLSYREITAKRVTPMSFLSLISLKYVLLQSIIILVGKVKLGILHAGVFKNIYIKEKFGCKFNIFNRRLVLINQVFARTLATFRFRC